MCSLRRCWRPTPGCWCIALRPQSLPPQYFVILIVTARQVSAELHEGLLQCLVQLANDEARRTCKEKTPPPREPRRLGDLGCSLAHESWWSCALVHTARLNTIPWHSVGVANRSVPWKDWPQVHVPPVAISVGAAALRSTGQGRELLRQAKPEGRGFEAWLLRRRSWPPRSRRNGATEPGTLRLPRVNFLLFSTHAIALLFEQPLRN